MKKEQMIYFIKELIAEYFENRNFKDILSHMEENTSWIGTGKNEISHNLKDAKNALSKEFIEYGDNFKVTEDMLHYVPILDNYFIVYGTLCAIPNDPILAKEDLRVSAVVHVSNHKLTILHLHFSHADTLLDDGSYYVKQSVRQNNENLIHELTLRDLHLANLTKNIPGGMHKCANDNDLTLLSISDGFLSMFGYTKEDIDQLFDGKYIHMIYPSDREKTLQTLIHQTKMGDEIDLEYRVLCKDGPPLWVLDKGRLIDDGNDQLCYYCLLIDITERNKQQEELRLSLERHQVIMDQATDIIFEWDIRKDCLSFSANWEKKFGYPPIDSNISNRIPFSNNIHKEDMPSFIKLMEKTARGVPYSETEFRIKDFKDRFYWCRIRATTQYNTEGQPVKAVGIIVDIDNEKKQKEELLSQAQHDILTGLYNKATMNSLVEQRMYLGGYSGYQALLIMDIDYFKVVNDTYGHLCGDSVLSSVASCLKKNIRSSDLIGRIGGDEFLIYLTGIQDKQSVETKAKQIIASVSKIVPTHDSKPISCSIGGVLIPHNTIDYETLFQYADMALYHQKHNGRGGVSFWNPDMLPIHSTYRAIESNIVSDDRNVLDEKLAQYVFRTLYESTDIENTINRLLEIIGQASNVSRVYVFEDSKDGRYCSNTFEWCNEGIVPQMHLLQNVDYHHELLNYRDNFNEEGVFYCRDIESLTPDVYHILKPQGIYSMLQCAMLDEGKFVGYIGFDECSNNHCWTKLQTDSFKLIADIFSTFIIKRRQKKT